MEVDRDEQEDTLGERLEDTKWESEAGDRELMDAAVRYPYCIRVSFTFSFILTK